MARLRYNGLTATLGAELGAADTTITFASALTHAGGGTDVPTITGSDYIPLAILNPVGTLLEIVHLTAYTSGATTGTITRAQESTTAVVRASGSTVVNGPTAADFTTGSTPEAIGVALSDETTAITTGTAKSTIRMPFAMTLTGVRASVTTASSSGVVTVDINEGGTSVLSTKLTIDASEKTSTTAAAAAVISDAALADDAEVTFDIDTAGTGATGLKVWLIGTRA